MLIRPYDSPRDDAEWKRFLFTHTFGQFIIPTGGASLPIIVPSHFVYDGDSTILLHLARANPIWEVLETNSTAIMSVIGAYAYIPTYVNADASEEEGFGVPTTYYASVQAVGECAVVDDPHEMAEILNALLANFQPEGGHAEVKAGNNPYARQFSAIRGIRMTLTEVRAKFKFGGNKSVEHRRRIAEWLVGQGGELRQDAAAHVLERTPVR